MGRRRKGHGENLSGYFRGVFQERSNWLHEPSNDLVLARYREDHGMTADQQIPEQVRNNLANLKSKMRKEEREGAGVTSQHKSHAPATAVAKRSSNHRMDQLEEQIDDCLTLAKNVDREQLETVITLLRRARNAVVWKIGQP